MIIVIGLVVLVVCFMCAFAALTLGFDAVLKDNKRDAIIFLGQGSAVFVLALAALVKVVVDYSLTAIGAG